MQSWPARYERSKKPGDEGKVGVTGHRHGSRARSLTGTFGPIEIAVPRAGLNIANGKTAEWKSQALRAYQRRTLAADALIAGCYLAGTNTRRVRRALGALFGGAVGKDIVSRTWRKVKGDWDAWNTRLLAGEPRAPPLPDHRALRRRQIVVGVRARRQGVPREFIGSLSAQLAAVRRPGAGSR